MRYSGPYKALAAFLYECINVIFSKNSEKNLITLSPWIDEENQVQRFKATSPNISIRIGFPLHFASHCGLLFHHPEAT